MKKVEEQTLVIIGAGIGGLSSAWYARQAGFKKIIVLEASNRVGGCIRSSERDGCILEHGPDSIVSTKPAGLQLIKELGLENEVQGTNPDARSACIVRNGKLLRVPEGLYLMAPSRWLPFLTSPLLSWVGKFRVGLELFIPRRNKMNAGQEEGQEESLADFVRRRLGKEALDYIAQPMIGGIYTADPERLSLEHCMPQFVEMEVKHGSIIKAMRKNSKERKRKSQENAEGSASGPRYSVFLSLRGGLQKLTDVLKEKCFADEQAELYLNSEVTQLEIKENNSWKIVLSNGSEIFADSCVSALPVEHSARLFQQLQSFDNEQQKQAKKLALELLEIECSSVATCNIAFAKDAFIGKEIPPVAGFVVPSCEGEDILAASFSSQKYLDRAPADMVVIRAFCGGALHPEQLEGGDEAVMRRAVQAVQKLLGVTADPLWNECSVWKKSMVQPIIGHGKRIKRIRELEKTLPNCVQVGNAFEGVGIPDLIQQAQTSITLLKG